MAGEIRIGTGGWRFEFARTGSPFITHHKERNVPAAPIRRYVEPLGPAVILWQLPPAGGATPVSQGRGLALPGPREAPEPAGLLARGPCQ